MIKLIATDMDGTLLKSNGEMPNGFYELFNTLTNKGVYFVVASGRQYHTLFDDFAQLKDQMIFIAENGAIVMHHGKELFCLALERKKAREIIGDIREIENCDIVLCGKKSAYIENSEPDFWSEAKKYYRECQRVGDLLAIDDDVLKIAVYDYAGSENCFNKLCPKWGDSSNVIISGKHWMDFGRQDVDKGVALKHIQSDLGVSYNESLVFGDYFNDVPMMEAAYYNYAMENSPYEVKTKTRFTAPSNDDEGVMKVIETLISEGLI
jgi:Cof subfamily protein (haloacid dehalogenase superfamily)